MEKYRLFNLLRHSGHSLSKIPATTALINLKYYVLKTRIFKVDGIRDVRFLISMTISNNRCNSWLTFFMRECPAILLLVIVSVSHS
ncbi:hypothetical protein [Flavobacterium sp. TSSA_36]|uniref:hypothetical protein n=1 Tax=Flavobacterium sp. TSSA_36 TaxID=3447669 RepID=UPI003F3780E9